MTDPADPRARLLDATMAYAAAHGLADLSLRQLAQAIGASHRMLIYHFGSKEGLLTEVVREVERRQRVLAAAIDDDAGLSPGDQVRAAWKRFADPAMWPQERLFFDVYAQALQGHPHAAPLLADVVEAWVAPIAARAIRHGTPAATAAAEARLMVAVTRGLLLDLLAGGDPAAVDAAMALHVAAYERRLADAR
ncbi:TetR/AcrR family transcriptional regulator [Caulobacter sp. KR2-114]|uniref:TetR/AcrR family transcriptional regulator n=1 Tax=Caulobacter sp. KR2-114 TaxID=3400912 RepID=UPI003C03DE46